ncbi:hypothetical protein TNCV_1007791 [Trichonephila clavipes]|nr:hypothetical protein TNCV_1007791 [Trichonephila clavipes]
MVSNQHRSSSSSKLQPSKFHKATNFGFQASSSEPQTSDLREKWFSGIRSQVSVENSEKSEPAPLLYILSSGVSGTTSGLVQSLVTSPWQWDTLMSRVVNKRLTPTF